MKYRVTHEFHTKITNRDIEADSEEEAIKVSREQISGNMIACEAETYDETATEQDEE